MPDNFVTSQSNSADVSNKSALKQLTNHKANTKSAVRTEIITGLSAESKYISSKFFYDQYGSQLFEWITQLPEYYPTRTEKSIICKYGDTLFGQLSHVHLIELGSGDCSKISLVLNAIDKKRIHTVNYCPIDFSDISIEKSTNSLRRSFPNLEINGMVADFTKLQSLPNDQPRIICFFGSTIGNFEPYEAEQLLTQIQNLMNPGDQLIVGLDLVKDLSIIEAAYNDSQRITEAFNKNILRHCNAHLRSNIYPPQFQHLAFFNHDKSRIEMHLIAKEDLVIESPFMSQSIEVLKGESIHTENSHKYSLQSINELADKCSLHIKRIFYDDKKWFSIVQFVK